MYVIVPIECSTYKLLNIKVYSNYIIWVNYNDLTVLPHWNPG